MTQGGFFCLSLVEIDNTYAFKQYTNSIKKLVYCPPICPYQFHQEIGILSPYLPYLGCKKIKEISVPADKPDQEREKKETKAQKFISTF
jgi:hypothetical protein